MSHVIHKNLGIGTKYLSTLLVLTAYRDGYPKHNKSPDLLLQEWTGQPKVCWSAMEREFGRGFVNYGMSLRVGFLTAEGVAKLAELEKENDIRAT